MPALRKSDRSVFLARVRLAMSWLATVDHLPPGSDFERGHVDGRRLAQLQKLRQPLGVVAVVLVLGPDFNAKQWRAVNVSSSSAV
jgi:hypothetical protein